MPEVYVGWGRITRMTCTWRAICPACTAKPGLADRQAWMDNNKEVKELEDTGMDRMRAAMDFVQQLPASPTMLPSRLQAEATMQQLQTLSISQAAVLRCRPLPSTLHSPLCQ